jgi:hypothetical protein
MQVIARIPQVRAPVEPAPAVRDVAAAAGLAPPGRQRQTPLRRPPRRGRQARAPWRAAALRLWAVDVQSWTVAGLTAVALVAWSLASWNEARRADPQRQPARIAVQPPSLAAPPSDFQP